VESFVFADFIDGDDIWVIEACGSFGFDEESADCMLGGEGASEDHFESNKSAKGALTRTIDDAHPPPS
jgi:hypothetical protein